MNFNELSIEEAFFEGDDADFISVMSSKLECGSTSQSEQQSADSLLRRPIFKVYKDDSGAKLKSFRDDLSELNEKLKRSANLEEKTVLKNKIRMVKNKIYAQQSRDRKKDQLVSLEKENKDLVQTNIKLQDKIAEQEEYIKSLEFRLSQVCSNCSSVSVENISTCTLQSRNSKCSVFLGLCLFLVILLCLAPNKTRNIRQTKEIRLMPDKTVAVYSENKPELSLKSNKKAPCRLLFSKSEKALMTLNQPKNEVISTKNLLNSTQISEILEDK